MKRLSAAVVLRSLSFYAVIAARTCCPAELPLIGSVCSATPVFPLSTCVGYFAKLNNKQIKS